MTDLKKRTDEALVRIDDFYFRMRNLDRDGELIARGIDYASGITHEVVNSASDEKLYNKIKFLVKTFDKQCKDLAIMTRGKKESYVINTTLNIIGMVYVKNKLQELLDNEDAKENKDND